MGKNSYFHVPCAPGVGNIVGVQALSEKIPGKGLGHIKHKNDPFLTARLETAPFAKTLSRPEEIRGASGFMVNPHSGRVTSVKG
jgi:hypothetical protein